MASCEQRTIEQASLHETPALDASRDATEATPLVTSNRRKYGNKESVLIKSKAPIMILCWTVLTLSPLKPSYDGHSSGHFQKFVVPTVLELCTHCRYQHMRIELLFHVVSLICCLEVPFVQ